MAALSTEVKAFIVQSLACYETPAKVIELVKENFKVTVTRQQVSAYDPANAMAKSLSQKWVDLFNSTRTRFQTEITDIPIANKAYRLRALDRMMTKAKWPKPPSYSVPLFNCADVVLLREREEAVEYLAKLGLDFDMSGFNGFAYSHQREGKTPILIIGVFVHEPSVLAHEACHIAFEICHHVGIPTNNNEMNETFCYLVQRIVYAFLPYIQEKQHVTEGE